MAIATSPLTGRIHQGRVNTAGTAFIGNKTDVTSDVLKAVIEKAEFHGGQFDIQGGNSLWIVTVKKSNVGERMKTQHTPGPWMLLESSDPGAFDIQDDEGTVLCSRYAYEEKAVEFMANARLIAAAPELLAELAKVMSWIKHWSPEFTNDPEWPEDRDRALTAIAAATGKQA